MPEAFKEIAHSGGKIILSVRTEEDGRRVFNQIYTSSRPVPSVITGLYALADQGLAVAAIKNMPGMGDSFPPPPLGGCIVAFISSDSQGLFGHSCPRCDGYWRSATPWPNVCPYCRLREQPHHFLSESQRRYVAHYCDTLIRALHSGEDGDFTIDMDEVADAVGKDASRPAFYVSEESQQHKFKCVACNEFNDVIGRYAYCSACATRNDATEFGTDMEALRARVSADQSSNIVRDCISAFDNIVGQLTKQLLNKIPLSQRRKQRLRRGRFHDLDETSEVLDWFDIQLFRAIPTSDRDFIRRMFLRRHVYEHNGGEVDSHYLKESGDTSVRLKQRLSESIEHQHRLIGILMRMAENLSRGFHELLPPLDEPIKAREEHLARMRQYHTGR